MTVTLKPHQEEVLNRLESGKVLRGGVGSGKTITALAWAYTKVMGAELGNMSSIKTPMDILVITTAKKRDKMDWEEDAAKFAISTHEGVGIPGVNLVVDSWNNIQKYKDVKNQIFIADEQRAVGSGKWSKAFIKIAKNNHWLLLSATPGDTWVDYIPLFVANGFYKNKTEFIQEHVVMNNYGPYPKIDRYVNTGRLMRHKRAVLVEMPYVSHATRHINWVEADYDADVMRTVMRKRWHVFEKRPIKDAGELFRVMRKVANLDPSRIDHVRALLKKHPKLIVFYSFDYELEELRKIAGYWTDEEGEGEEYVDLSRGARVLSAKVVGKNFTDDQVYVGRPSKWGNPFVIGKDGDRKEVIEKYRHYIQNSPLMADLDELRGKDLVCWCAPEPCHADILLELANPKIEVAEYNGHKHQEIPDSESWVYLVQYTAGAEGWNCIETDAMCFYSLQYSYKIFEQCQGRIDRMNTPFYDLYYYVIRSNSVIDRMIWKSLVKKEDFNERKALAGM